MKPARFLAASAALALVLSIATAAQAKPKSKAAPVQTPASDRRGEVRTAAPATGGPTLEAVLDKMDKTAATFKNARANFIWDQFQRVVNETDTQKGKIYFRRAGNDLNMAADIAEPEKKIVVYSGARVQMYQPKIDQVTVYTTKNKTDFETFLVLGFGGRGSDLKKSFDVKLDGHETIDGAHTAKLDLVPKTQKSRGVFSHIALWIDLDSGVSVRQQFFEPSGDYRLARYSHIEINGKVPDDAFRIKTTSKTKFVRPQG